MYEQIHGDIYILGMEKMQKYILMLDPVTGRSGGKRKRTVVMITYTIPICDSSISMTHTGIR